MGKNCSVNKNRTKEVVRYLYFLAKRKNLLDDLMRESGVTNSRSLQWSYQQGRISEDQIAGYVNVLGINRDFITGATEMTAEDKRRLEQTLAEGIEINVSEEANRNENEEDLDLIEAFSQDIEDADEDILKDIKLQIQILLKKVELKELQLIRSSMA